MRKLREDDFMSDKKLSIDSTSALRTFVLSLLVTSAWAAPQENLFFRLRRGL